MELTRVPNTHRKTTLRSNSPHVMCMHAMRPDDSNSHLELESDSADVAAVWSTLAAQFVVALSVRCR